MKIKSIIFSVLCLMMAVCMMFTAVGCDSSVSAASVDLMNGVTANKVKGNPIDEAYLKSQTNLAVELFKQSYSKSSGKNTLVAPVSVSLALSMTANGAKGNTLEELEAFLGNGLSIEQLNKYHRTYLNTLPKDKTTQYSIANSVWFKDSKQFEANNSFLQTNADWYGAGVFKAPFDNSTVNDINNWVKNNTDGKIDRMVDSIGDRTLMYLINAVSFDAKWLTQYNEKAVSKGTFTTADRKFQTAEYMCSTESTYLDDGKATGFMKHYTDGFSFVALLPNAGIRLDDYVNGLTADGITKTLKSKSDQYSVTAYLPKFSYSCELSLNDSLKAAGVTTAFDEDKADFSNLGKTDGNIYLSDVLHKTTITVNESGTEASASTKVEMTEKMSLAPSKTVRLDRPFVYMIVDTNRDLPIFIGTLISVED